MNLPNKISLIRIGMIPVFVLVFFLNGILPFAHGIAGIIFVLAACTDFIDGYIARHYNQTTDFGKFLDPLADKLLTIAAMTCFCEWGVFPAWALMIVLTREFAVTGLRLVAVQKGIAIAAGWSGKVKTASTMVGLCAMMALPGIPWLSWLVITIIVVTTVYSGVEYFIQNWKCLWE